MKNKIAIYIHLPCAITLVLTWLILPGLFHVGLYALILMLVTALLQLLLDPSVW